MVDKAGSIEPWTAWHGKSLSLSVGIGKHFWASKERPLGYDLVAGSEARVSATE